MDNLFGWGATRYWGEVLGLIEPRPPSMYQISCACGGGYLSSFFALGGAFLVGTLLAFAVGAMLPRRKIWATALILGWLAIVGWALYADYARIETSIGPLSADSRDREFLALYWQSIPVQFLFDIVVGLILPASIAYGIGRFRKDLARRARGTGA